MKKIIAGVDEAGRGSLIGPVYAAAVILKKNINKKSLKDSKKISKKKREVLNRYIKKSYEVLKSYKNIKKERLLEKLVNYWYTWDNYSISIMYLACAVRSWHTQET